MLAISPTDRIVVLTGAGVSAESGIPTFRGVGGLWRNHRIEEVASPHAWRRDPRLVWEFYSIRRCVAAVAKPNPAHFALASLERKLQDRLFHCTQNVDDLHEQAGAKHVLHMHGELFKSRCDSCSRAPFQDRNTYDPPAEPPRCECAGRIRPHICWFGEVPFELDRIYEALRAMHSLYGGGNVRRGRARSQLCRACGWSCANNLRGSRGACERIRVHRMPFGESGRDTAKALRRLVNREHFCVVDNLPVYQRQNRFRLWQVVRRNLENIL